MSINSIKLKCDSELVVNQIKYEYQAKGEKNEEIMVIMKELIKEIEHFSI